MGQLKPVRLGTRGSRLALAQTRWVAERLESLGARTEIVTIETTGDRIRDVPLGPALGSSFFTKEIERALLTGSIDVAVHSCKDLAATLPEGLVLGAIPVREDVRDVLVCRTLDRAAAEAPLRVGTSSPRRRGILTHMHPEWSIVDQRGNVPTRVQAVDDGILDGAVLAAAGLRRLGMADRITVHFDPLVCVPAAAQGALAIQCRADDRRVASLLQPLDDPASSRAVAAERAVLRQLRAGCQAPVGVWAQVASGTVTVHAMIVAPDGVVRAVLSGDASTPEDVGERVAGTLLAELGVESLVGLPWIAGSAGEIAP